MEVKMMKVYIMFLLLLVSFASCNSKKDNDVEYYEVELNNKALEDEIWKYMEMIRKRDDHIADSDSIVFSVFCNAINDSTDRFVVSPFVNPELMLDDPFLFICKIKGRVVFFHTMGMRSYPVVRQPYFKLSEDSYKRLLERHFPVANASIKKYGYIYPQVCYEPELCCITVRNGAILETHTYRGLPDCSFGDKEH